ncbi:DUF167 domain-containing protein [Sphingomonas alba]|uniref:UPF0235 protein LZ536_00110 n=1 Tax=Sphingomonas alba TaxID=2908208 RepID=A0ABT0RI90_9SPHN|nr:DUF167 domain-containing protein [Sphingomonas alba]MCL6682307.1 DUF167 domain-containing protein [Sphingomonas alba]
MSSILAIRVTPRSAKPGLGEWKTDPGRRPFLEVRVAAAPADGSANEEVIKLIANALGVPKSEVRIVSGATARLKRLEVPLSDEDCRARLT